MASHTGLSQTEREVLHSLASYLLCEDLIDPPSLSTTDSDRVSPDIASVPDADVHLERYPLSTESFRDPPHELNDGANLLRPMPGASTGSSHRAADDDGLHSIVSYTQSTDSFQGVTLSSSRKRRIDPRVEGCEESHGVRNRLSTLKSKKKENSGTYEFEKASCSSKESFGHSITKIRAQLTFQHSSPYAYMHDAATRLQKNSEQRLVMIEKTLSKWLPVYTVTVKSELKNPELEAKMQILFEQLWLANMWFLYSFDYDILVKTDSFHRGQDDLMIWVVHQISKPGGILPLLEPHQDISIEPFKTDDLQRYLYSFIKNKTENEYLAIMTRRKLLIPIEKEAASACELAAYILDAYYLSSNAKRYKEIFSSNGDLGTRLIRFTKVKRSSKMIRWKNYSSTHYGKAIVPWAEKQMPEEPADIPWNDGLQKKFSQMCQERLDQLNQQAYNRYIPTC